MDKNEKTKRGAVSGPSADVKLTSEEDDALATLAHFVADHPSVAAKGAPTVTKNEDGFFTIDGDRSGNYYSDEATAVRVALAVAATASPK